MLTAVAVVAMAAVLVGAVWYIGRKAEKSFDQSVGELGQLRIVEAG